MQKEQYLDFLRNRRFRQTLLCRQEVPLDRLLRREALRGLYLGSSAQPAAARPDVDSPGVVVEFRGRGDSRAVDRPSTRKGRDAPSRPGLAAHDRASTSSCGPSAAAKRAPTRPVALLDILLAAYTAGVVELSTHAPRFALSPGPRPTASPIARLQLEHGAFVASLRHTSIHIKDDLARRLLKLMDGTRTLEMLRHELEAHDPAEPAPVEVSAAVVGQKVIEAARLALLIA